MMIFKKGSVSLAGKKCINVSGVLQWKPKDCEEEQHIQQKWGKYSYILFSNAMFQSVETTPKVSSAAPNKQGNKEDATYVMHLLCNLFQIMQSLRTLSKHLKIALLLQLKYFWKYNQKIQCMNTLETLLWWVYNNFKENCQIPAY